MKKVLSLVAAMIMIFAFTAVSFAAEQGMAPSAVEKKEAVPTMKVEKKHHAKKTVRYHRIVGEVSAVDAGAGTLTVKHRKGETAVSLYTKTRIKYGKEKKSLEDIKAGEKVTVRYKEESGKKVATSIYIWHAAKKAKHVKKAEKKEAVSMKKQEASMKKDAAVN